MKILLGLLFGLLLLSIPSLATNYCPDNNTTNFTINYYNTTGGFNSFTYNTTCPNGCNNFTGDCNPSPYESSNWILLILLPIIAFVLLYLNSLLKREDWVIHLLLMFSALFFLITPIGVIQSMGQQTNNTYLSGTFAGLYQVTLIIFTVITFIYMLKLVITSIRVFGK